MLWLRPHEFAKVYNVSTLPAVGTTMERLACYSLQWVGSAGGKLLTCFHILEGEPTLIPTAWWLSLRMLVFYSTFYMTPQFPASTISCY